MNNYSTLTKFFLVTSSFAGGLALGRWIEQQSRETLDLSTKRLQNIREQIQQEIDRNVPDLYRATEQLHLDKNDFPHG